MMQMGETAPRLAESHVRELASSAIPSDLALCAGLWSESDPGTLAKLTGRARRAWTEDLLPALVFPYLAPGEVDPALFNVKPARPLPSQSDKTGAIELLKYVRTARQPVRLYWPPGLRVSARDRGDVGRALLITEGEKKTLAAEAAGFLCVGLTGVSCWSERRGKKRVLHRDFEHVALKGRRVFVVFDSDAVVNILNVRREEKALVEALLAAGAMPHVVRLPDGEGGAKQGLDDFLVARGRAALEQLCNSAKPATPAKIDATPVGAPLGATALTDLGNAERLVRDHGADLRWVGAWSRWLVWDGRRWEIDQTGEAMRRCASMVRALYGEAARCTDPELRVEIVRHAQRSEGARSMKAALELARDLPSISITPDKLDSDRWLLNVQNGTLELNTGMLREHRREDLLTKIAPVAFDRDAQAPTWLAFLGQIFADQDAVIAFLARAVGYTLTGSTQEHKLFFCYGTGRNGKSTFLTSIEETLGPYATQTAPELIVERENRGEAHPTEVADLQGVRFAVVAELKRDRSLDDSLVKRLTGEKRIKARFMRQDFFTFEASHKLWIATNHRPTVKGTDEGIWRRIVMIPFEVTISAEKEDRSLLDRIAAERAGILAWAVRGCLEWRQSGLQPPREVLAATADYRADSDILGGFVAAHCAFLTGASTWARDLYGTYTRWCEQSGEEPVTQKTFGSRLRERGLSRSRGHGGAYRWHGIVLRDVGANGEPLNRAEPFPGSATDARAHLKGNGEKVHQGSMVHRDDRSDFQDRF
jgi:P4 family phage/plasmid primase-like protien